MDLGSAFELVGKDTLALVLEEGKQNIVRLRIKVKDGDDIFGEKTLRFIVTQKQSGLKQTMPAMLSVRPASARYGTVTLGMLSEKNKNMRKTLFFHENCIRSSQCFPQVFHLHLSRMCRRSCSVMLGFAIQAPCSAWQRLCLCYIFWKISNTLRNWTIFQKKK